MALSDTRIRQSKPRDRAYKLADGGGLYLEVTPKGNKLWRLRYRIDHKENVYAIGPYPGVTLAEARDEREKAKKLIRKAIHPAHQRKLDKLKQIHANANTFEAVGREWLENNTQWTTRSRHQRTKLLERDVFPAIGSVPIKNVTPLEVLTLLKLIEKRAPSMAVLANQAISGIYRLAVSTLRADSDLTGSIRDSLQPLQTTHHQPLKLREIPAFFLALDNDVGSFINKIAMQMLFLTLVRTVEVLGARWDEFDLDNALWVIPKERMKMSEAHTVPLATQTIELLDRLHSVSGKREHLFPSREKPTKPASKGVLWKMTNRMGYAGKFSPHGVRATGSTILNELGHRSDVIEYQLAHKERNKTRASYNRAEYLEERRKMMQQWADLLSSETGEGQVVVGRFNASL